MAGRARPGMPPLRQVLRSSATPTRPLKPPRQLLEQKPGSHTHIRAQERMLELRRLGL